MTHPWIKDEVAEKEMSLAIFDYASLATQLLSVTELCIGNKQEV